MNLYSLIRKTYMLIGESEFAENFEFPLERFCHVLETAQMQVMKYLRHLPGNYFSAKATLSIEAGATAVDLPDDFLVAEMLKDAANRSLTWEFTGYGYEEAPVRFQGNQIAWDTAAKAATTWTLWYVRKPARPRTGKLAGVTNTSALVLPVQDSAGRIPSSDDALNGHVLTLIGGNSDGEESLVSDYAGSTRTVTVSPAHAVVAPSDALYVIGEDWPSEAIGWLAAECAMGLDLENQAAYQTELLCQRDAFLTIAEQRQMQAHETIQIR